jgi:hypothetical protein
VLSCTCAGIKIKYPLLKECTRLFNKIKDKQHFSYNTYISSHHKSSMVEYIAFRVIKIKYSTITIATPPVKNPIILPNIQVKHSFIHLALLKFVVYFQLKYLN